MIWLEPCYAATDHMIQTKQNKKFNREIQKTFQEIQKMKYDLAPTRYVTMQLTQWFQPQEATIISFTKSWSTVILKVSQNYQ